MQSKVTTWQGVINMDPVRLQRKQPARKPPIMEVLNKVIVVKIKFYALIGALMILFLLVCFMAKGPTYGFL